MGVGWPDGTSARQGAGNAACCLVRFEQCYRRMVFCHYEQPLTGLTAPTAASGGCVEVLWVLQVKGQCVV